MIPQDLKYTNDHEWIRLNAEIAEVGITHFAQEQLGDIVYVELPAVGATLTRGQTFGVVESVKTVSDLYAPVTGEVVEVNPELLSESDDFKPELVNDDPFGQGWMVRVRLSEPSEIASLLDAAAYKKITEEAG
ncbi:MAG: glycine cleavage system protein GcvH [Candidatus Xenobium sp.]|jgi:glycine cleavage system H protein|nr:glycine cleavage system protein GcvH [Burkholderiales bacterium]